MGTNIDVATRGEPGWDLTDVKGSLQRVRDYAEGEAIKASGWYLDHKRWKARWSRSLRIAAIVSTALAGLYPIAAMTIPRMPDEAKNALIPSFLFGLTAAFLGADRAFGFSSGWIRYINAGMSIRRAIEEFRMDWTLKLARLGDPVGANGALELIQMAKTFRLAIETVVADETRVWTAEFQASLAQLEKEARDQVEHARARTDESEKASRVRAESEAKAREDASRPGRLELTVANAVEVDGRTVQVHLEGTGVEIDEVMEGATRHAFIGLEPGAYRLVVSGRSGANAVNDEVTCEVLPGQTAKAELRLPLALSGAQREAREPVR